MARKSVLGNPSTVSKVSKEGFNMNQTFTFTCSTGMLLPVWYDLLSPGEKVSGFPSFLLRSEPLLAPAMADLDCFVDVFFVPLNKVFSAFGEWFYQIDDIKSNYFDTSRFISRLPIIGSEGNNFAPFAAMTDTLYNAPMSLYTYPNDNKFDRFGFGMHRLLQHLGRNAQSIFWSAAWNYQDIELANDQNPGILSAFKSFNKGLTSPRYSPWLEACYQAIYMDYFRPDMYEANDINSYNLDTYFNDGVGVIPFNPGTGVWKSRGLFQLRYRCKSADYFVASKPAPLFSNTSMLPNASQNLMKVNQWLSDGLGEDEIWLENPGGQVIQPGQQSVGSNVGSSLGFSGVSSSDFGRWLSSNDSSLPPDQFVRTGTSSNSLKVEIDGNASGIKHTHTYVGSATGLTTARLRTMFALEKLAKITYRAGKHYDDQTLAHFGYKVPQGISGEVYHLKSYHSPFVINRVISTANTADGALGEQAGTGASIMSGQKEGKFSFVAPCHGVVMALFSIAPRYKYLLKHEKFGYKTQLWDFFKPAIDNLGMQPLFNYELGYNPHNDRSLDTSVNSWQWRFMEDKLKADKVSLVFSTIDKNPWSFTALPGAGSLGDILVSPTDLNLLFNVQYNPWPDWPGADPQSGEATYISNFPVEYLRDPFTVDFVMKANKASYMSTYGDTPISGI